jgi:hypothetical protein
MSIMDAHPGLACIRAKDNRKREDFHIIEIDNIIREMIRIKYKMKTDIMYYRSTREDPLIEGM